MNTTKRYLFIGSHPDDIELCCGATIAALNEQGHHVTIVTLSVNFSGQSLLHEFNCSMLVMAPESYFIKNFQPRRFCDFRQELLDYLLTLKADYVFTHDPEDRHQDHAVVGVESLRAFKNVNLITFTAEWNRIRNHNTLYVPVKKGHLETKVRALSCYESQRQRPYMDAHFIYAQAIVNGIACGHEYAEAFEVKRMIYDTEGY